MILRLAAGITSAVLLGEASKDVNGPLTVPLRGWSSWNTFRCNSTESTVRETILTLSSSPLFKAGYNWVMIDDGWTKCLKFRDNENGSCDIPAPRDANGRIVIDEQKFPNGFNGLVRLANERGVKLGIYTSVSAITCGGFTGSLHNEDIDAQTFVEWGFQLIKHDTCGVDISIHDGSLQAAVGRMREAIWKAGAGRIVYYLDHGNPTASQRVYNPRQWQVSDPEVLKKVASKPSELAWNWVSELAAHDQKGPHMLKTWFDIIDDWRSTVSNLHNQMRTAEYQRCGFFLFPDYLTIGQGKQSLEQYKTQFFLWAVLGTPLVLGADLRNLSSVEVDVLTSPEILEMNADSDCLQASLARSLGGQELWIKPLHDGSFAMVIFNTATFDSNVTAYLNGHTVWHDDFFPASFDNAIVRDLYSRQDLGTYNSSFTVEVAAQSARIFKVTPLPTDTNVIAI
jgi:alpha-galactosidase